MKKNLYFVEVGVLLTEEDEEFDYYHISNFHNEFGFYDENKLTFLTPQEAKKYALQYVKDGVEYTYAILYNFNCNITQNQLQEIKDFKRCDYSLEMDAENISEFFYKHKGIIREAL